MFDNLCHLARVGDTDIYYKISFIIKWLAGFMYVVLIGRHPIRDEFAAHVILIGVKFKMTWVAVCPTHGILNLSPIKITWAANFFRDSCPPTHSHFEIA